MTEITAAATSRTLATEQGDLHYHDHGEGPPFVMLHGSGPGVSAWANFAGNLETFGEHFRCLALDMPGFGTSHATASPPLDAPDAVIRFLDGLGLEKVALLGNSLGGGVAARVAAAHPDRITRLVTIGGVGVPFFSALPSEGITRLVEFVENPTRELLVQWMRSMVYDQSILTDEFVEMRWQAANDPAAMEGIKQIYSREMLDILRTMMLDNTAMFGMLRQIQAPTLITWGRDDRVTPLDGAIAPMRMIRNCELHVFHDCGHWSMIERKDEFESTVLAYLSRDLG
ncbi:MAG: alpha/beta fold hydrolase [Acidimicrobiales bacterium]